MKFLLPIILAFGTLLTSVFTITSKNPVVSVIFLICTFVQAAGYLILSGVTFIGIAYIVVYVGAIAVLFLFIIMMINIKLTDILETGSQYTKNLPLALAIGSLFIFIIFTIVPFNFNSVSSMLLPVLSSLDFINDLFISFSTKTIINLTYMSMDLNSWLLDHSFILLEASDYYLTKFEQIEVLGHSLYTYGGVLLITLSIILLLAMFATIIISRSNQE